MDFVALSPDNAATYSNEFAKLLLLAGSEIDVVAKQLCQALDPSNAADSTDHYQRIIAASMRQGRVHRPMRPAFFTGLRVIRWRRPKQPP